MVWKALSELFGLSRPAQYGPVVVEVVVAGGPLSCLDTAHAALLSYTGNTLYKKYNLVLYFCIYITIRLQYKHL